MHRPPSMSIHAPVMNLDSSLARKQAALATSSGLHTLPRGIVPSILFRPSGLSNPPKTLGNLVTSQFSLLSEAGLLR